MSDSTTDCNVYHFNDDGCAPVLLVCEHASAHIPAQFDNLGLNQAALSSHIAFDIGALALAKLLAEGLDAPLLATTVSRLVYDCNRARGAADAAPAKSEIYDIPGNAEFSGSELERRYEQFYQPFEQAVTARLDAYASLPMFVTVHSFTPVYHGRERELDVGVIANGESKLADHLLLELDRSTSLRCALNEPYGAADGVTHTLDFHANSRGAPNAMIEVNNSLLGSDNGCVSVANTLVSAIASAARCCGYPVSAG